MFTLLMLFCGCATAKGQASAPAASSRYESYDTQYEDRMIAYTVSLTLKVKNREDAKAKIFDEITKGSGYLIEESANYIGLWIPAGNLDGFIQEIKTFGTVENERKTGIDITEQYRDNEIRLENLKKVRDRYQNLLEEAMTVADMVSIEKELERVNTEIDLFERKIRSAEQSVTYSKVSVYYSEKTKPGPLGWIFYGLYQGIKWLFVWG